MSCAKIEFSQCMQKVESNVSLICNSAGNFIVAFERIMSSLLVIRHTVSSLYTL